MSFFRGVGRIFQRGGHRGYSLDHHPGIADYIWFIPLLSLVYQRAQSYYRGMKAIDKSRWRKHFTKNKKVGFSTMAFTAMVLSWRFRHLNIVGCLLKRRPTKGGSRVPQDPPSYAPVFKDILSRMKKKNNSFHVEGRWRCKFPQSGTPSQNNLFPKGNALLTAIHSSFVWHLEMLDLRCRWFWCVESYTWCSRCWRPILHQCLLKSGEHHLIHKPGWCAVRWCLVM